MSSCGEESHDLEAADEIVERDRAGEWDSLPIDGERVSIDTTNGFPVTDELALGIRHLLGA